MKLCIAVDLAERLYQAFSVRAPRPLLPSLACPEHAAPASRCVATSHSALPSEALACTLTTQLRQSSVKTWGRSLDSAGAALLLWCCRGPESSVERFVSLLRGAPFQSSEGRHRHLRRGARTWPRTRHPYWPSPPNREGHVCEAVIVQGLSASTNSAIVRASASLTLGCGGITSSPQTPVPPARILVASMATAPALPA